MYNFDKYDINNAKLVATELAHRNLERANNAAISENKVIIDYKYNEDTILTDFKTYIDKTYGEHYKVNGLETHDAWLALGSASTTFRDIAIKYLWRNGRKGTKEDAKRDLFKALHYVLLLMYVDHYRTEGKVE